MEKIYVITGATSGIGKALLEKLCNNNVVFAGYRNEKYIKELEQKGTIPFYIDMEKPDSIVAAADFIKSKTQKIDRIINIAGCVVAGVMENLPAENLRKQFEVNTFSHIDFSQKLLPLLKNGRIINISSMASFGIFPFVVPYCASKRALDILFNAMNIESDIEVVSIKPGVIATPLWTKSIELNKNAIENCKEYDKEMKFMVKNAQQNSVKGLSVDKVVAVILKADKAKHPKLSYTVGSDAKMAELISKLPQGVLNKIIKIGIKLRIN